MALIVRQAALTFSPGRSAGSAGAHSQAGSISPPARKECRQCRYSFPGRQHWPSAQEGVQELFARQTVLTPQPGRSAGSAGALSQAGSISPPQPGRSAGTHFQSGSANPQPGRSAGSAVHKFTKYDLFSSPQLQALSFPLNTCLVINGKWTLLAGKCFSKIFSPCLASAKAERKQKNLKRNFVFFSKRI